MLMYLGQEELGRRIRQARDDADLSQSQLAELLGLGHPQSISRYERGETEVPQKRLRRIAEVTGKPLSFFHPDADDGEPAQQEQPEDPATLELAHAILEELRALRGDVQRLADPPAQPDTPRERDVKLTGCPTSRQLDPFISLHEPYVSTMRQDNRPFGLSHHTRESRNAMKRVTIAAAIIALTFAATASAASPNVAWSTKDMKTAIRGIGYPKPHPRKLACTGSGASSAGRFVSFRCVATYGHRVKRRFVTGGVAQGGWLCAGKTLSACAPLRRGFLPASGLVGSGDSAFGGAAEIASRGYMYVRYGIFMPTSAGRCSGSGMSWTCGYYATDTQAVAVTITFTVARGGYVVAAQTS